MASRLVRGVGSVLSVLCLLGCTRESPRPDVAKELVRLREVISAAAVESEAKHELVPFAGNMGEELLVSDAYGLTSAWITNHTSLAVGARSKVIDASNGREAPLMVLISSDKLLGYIHLPDHVQVTGGPFILNPREALMIAACDSAPRRVCISPHVPSK